MAEFTNRAGLQVATELADFIESEALPGLGIDAAAFWKGVADIFARWQIPVILCAKTSLGTINHTLLSLEALKRRAIPVHGVAFIGEENQETQRIISKLGRTRSLGRLPRLGRVTADAVRDAFRENFDLACFTEMFA